MKKIFNFLICFLFIINSSFPVFARCAVCYTNGLSGASIAVIVIVTSFIFLFIANKILRKLIDRYNF